MASTRIRFELNGHMDIPNESAVDALEEKRQALVAKRQKMEEDLRRKKQLAALERRERAASNLRLLHALETSSWSERNAAILQELQRSASLPQPLESQQQQQQQREEFASPSRGRQPTRPDLEASKEAFAAVVHRQYQQYLTDLQRHERLRALHMQREIEEERRNSQRTAAVLEEEARTRELVAVKKRELIQAREQHRRVELERDHRKRMFAAEEHVAEEIAQVVRQEVEDQMWKEESRKLKRLEADRDVALYEVLSRTFAIPASHEQEGGGGDNGTLYNMIQMTSEALKEIPLRPEVLNRHPPIQLPPTMTSTTPTPTSTHQQSQPAFSTSSHQPNERPSPASSTSAAFTFSATGGGSGSGSDQRTSTSQPTLQPFATGAGTVGSGTDGASSQPEVAIKLERHQPSPKHETHVGPQNFLSATAQQQQQQQQEQIALAQQTLLFDMQMQFFQKLSEEMKSSEEKRKEMESVVLKLQQELSRVAASSAPVREISGSAPQRQEYATGVGIQHQHSASPSPPPQGFSQSSPLATFSFPPLQQHNQQPQPASLPFVTVHPPSPTRQQNQPPFASTGPSSASASQTTTPTGSPHLTSATAAKPALVPSGAARRSSSWEKQTRKVTVVSPPGSSSTQLQPSENHSIPQAIQISEPLTLEQPQLVRSSADFLVTKRAGGVGDSKGSVVAQSGESVFDVSDVSDEEQQDGVVRFADDLRRSQQQQQRKMEEESHHHHQQKSFPTFSAQSSSPQDEEEEEEVEEMTLPSPVHAPPPPPPPPPPTSNQPTTTTTTMAIASRQGVESEREGARSADQQQRDSFEMPKRNSRRSLSASSGHDSSEFESPPKTRPPQQPIKTLSSREELLHNSPSMQSAASTRSLFSNHDGGGDQDSVSSLSATKSSGLLARMSKRLSKKDLLAVDETPCLKLIEHINQQINTFQALCLNLEGICESIFSKYSQVGGSSGIIEKRIAMPYSAECRHVSEGGLKGVKPQSEKWVRMEEEVNAKLKALRSGQFSQLEPHLACSLLVDLLAHAPVPIITAALFVSFIDHSNWPVNPKKDTWADINTIQQAAPELLGAWSILVRHMTQVFGRMLCSPLPSHLKHQDRACECLAEALVANPVHAGALVIEKEKEIKNRVAKVSAFLHQLATPKPPADSDQPPAASDPPLKRVASEYGAPISAKQGMFEKFFRARKSDGSHSGKEEPKPTLSPTASSSPAAINPALAGPGGSGKFGAPSLSGAEGGEEGGLLRRSGQGLRTLTMAKSELISKKGLRVVEESSEESDGDNTKSVGGVSQISNTSSFSSGLPSKPRPISAPVGGFKLQSKPTMSSARRSMDTVSDDTMVQDFEASDDSEEERAVSSKPTKPTPSIVNLKGKGGKLNLGGSQPTAQSAHTTSKPLAVIEESSASEDDFGEKKARSANARPMSAPVMGGGTLGGGLRTGRGRMGGPKVLETINDSFGDDS